MKTEKKRMEETKFNARFPRPLFEELRELAREHERSINSELIWIVRAYLERQRRREKE
jgi:predicted HicB family RNase H-like nuclease